MNSIGKYAFWGCNNLTAVTIPNSVKSIGDQAFYNCKKLASIEMPNSNVEIGDFAFPQGLISSSIIRGNNTDNVQQKNTQSLELEREGTANKKKFSLSILPKITTIILPPQRDTRGGDRSSMGLLS